LINQIYGLFDIVCVAQEGTLMLAGTIGFGAVVFIMIIVILQALDILK